MLSMWYNKNIEGDILNGSLPAVDGDKKIWADQAKNSNKIGAMYERRCCVWDRII